MMCLREDTENFPIIMVSVIYVLAKKVTIESKVTERETENPLYGFAFNWRDPY